MGKFLTVPFFLPDAKQEKAAAAQAKISAAHHRAEALLLQLTPMPVAPVTPLDLPTLVVDSREAELTSAAPPLEAQLTPVPPPHEAQLAPVAPPCEAQLASVAPPCEAQLTPVAPPCEAQLTPVVPPREAQRMLLHPPHEAQLTPIVTPCEAQLTPIAPPQEEQQILDLSIPSPAMSGSRGSNWSTVPPGFQMSPLPSGNRAPQSTVPAASPLSQAPLKSSTPTGHQVTRIVEAYPRARMPCIRSLSCAVNNDYEAREENYPACGTLPETLKQPAIPSSDLTGSSFSFLRMLNGSTTECVECVCKEDELADLRRQLEKKDLEIQRLQEKLEQGNWISCITMHCDVYQCGGSSLVWVMAWYVFGTKPLPIPFQTYCFAYKIHFISTHYVMI